MMPILQAPHPGLRAVCTPVADFDDGLRALTDAMFAAMYDAPGRGLAAPQVGVLSRVFVMDSTWKDAEPRPMVFVNPQIVDRSSDKAAISESCLSIPDQPVSVPRPAWVTLRWQGLDGVEQTDTFEGVEAVIVQHERDHLDGILITDYAVQA
ncbi:peptide deformylase [Loktanella sp. TSTF-M6]|uniref:Peptide deformylase n=1 Tax=Loktanella gaetbuli TaxID=2881335 RepID=A0ABS8BWU7_9RHOB|nr:peptide deformylase [Loktanella gaetbuli]MCB5200169.1 peptide deformylase [Loktanella gaetbuli]